MRARLVQFGELEVEGRRYDHDLVIRGGQVAKRKKKPSKPHKAQFGHTPLSAEEDIPWGGKRLIVGTGVYGRLPVMDAVYEEAARRGVEVVALPTEEACTLLEKVQPENVFAVLHATC